MRPLNRPMFRYGGPIKEGVMSGIREPKKDGGMLLVGQHPNRFKDAGGREKHVAPIVYGAGLGLARLAPLALRGAKAFKNIFGTTRPFQGPVGSSVPGKLVASRAKGVRIPSSGSYSGVKFARTPSTTSPSGAPLGEMFVPNLLGRDPTVRLVGGVYKAVTDPRVTGVAGKAARLVISPTGAITGLLYANGKFFNKDTGEEVPPPPNAGDLKIGDRVTGTSGAPGGGDPDMYLEPQKSDGVELTAEERRAKNVERYRDIMDIKGMNKDAAYNSLIEASKLINESGDFKGDLKSGKLINQIIGATSKAFDKPKATKDAIDTLILKGEIEKDIKASDPSTKLLNEYRLKQMEKIDKDLQTGFAEAKIAASKNLSGQSAIDAAASVASENFKGNLITKTQLNDVMEKAKKSGDISEQNIIIAATTEVIKDKNLPDGDYTVGDVLVTITEGQITDIKR